MKKLFTFFAMVIAAATVSSCAPKVPESDRVLTEIDSLYCSGNAENMAKAREMLRELEREYPRYSDMLLMCGHMAVEDELYDLAVDYYTRAIECYGKGNKFDRWYLYGARAFAYRDMGDYEAAERDFTKVYDIAPDDNPQIAIGAMHYRADVRYLQQKYDESNADFQLMLERDSLDCAAIIGVARNYNAQGLYSEAIELANKSEQINPAYYATYKIRMQSYLELGENHKAIDDAVRFIDVNDFNDLSATDSIMMADFAYAHQCIDAKIKTDGRAEIWQYFKANLYSLAGEYDTCLAYLTELEKMYGATFEIIICRAACYKLMGDIEKEQAELAKAFENYPLDDIHEE